MLPPCLFYIVCSIVIIYNKTIAEPGYWWKGVMFWILAIPCIHWISFFGIKGKKQERITILWSYWIYGFFNGWSIGWSINCACNRHATFSNSTPVSKQKTLHPIIWRSLVRIPQPSVARSSRQQNFTWLRESICQPSGW